MAEIPLLEAPSAYAAQPFILMNPDYGHEPMKPIGRNFLAIERGHLGKLIQTYEDSIALPTSCDGVALHTLEPSQSPNEKPHYKQVGRVFLAPFMLKTTEQGIVLAKHKQFNETRQDGGAVETNEVAQTEWSDADPNLRTVLLQEGDYVVGTPLQHPIFKSGQNVLSYAQLQQALQQDKAINL